MEDGQDSIEFTKLENKIRRKWFFLSNFPTIIILGCALTFIFNSKFFIAADSVKVIGFVVFFILLVGGMYTSYYCTYKNPGTRVLRLMMIGTSLNLIKNLLSLENLALMRTSALFSLFILGIVFLDVIVFYYSYKLHKINKKMKERRLIVSPPYMKALAAFSTATNLEELNEQFTRLRTSPDSGIKTEVLVKAYGQQKRSLPSAGQ